MNGLTDEFVYTDTMGYAFTMNIVNWLSRGRVPVGAYVHYPTISTEMLARVRSRKRWHTNDDAISSSSLLSSGKLLYVFTRSFQYHGDHGVADNGSQVLPDLHVSLFPRLASRIIPDGELFVDEKPC